MKNLLLVAILVVSTSACTGTIYNKARQGVTGLDISLKGAALGFDAYDAKHQMDIAKDAKTKCAAQVPPPADLIACQVATGKPLLEEWDGVFKKVKLGFLAAEAALGTAALGIDAAEALNSGQSVIDALMAGAKAPIKDLLGLLAAAGMELPPVLSVAVGGV